MRRRAVEVEVVLLDVLAVVSLRVGQPEEALLEDRVAPVPEREREAERLAVVGDTGDPVLAPPVGERPREIVTEVAPGVPFRAVVLAHRPPLPLAQVRSPFFPGCGPRRGRQSPRLSRHLASSAVKLTTRPSAATAGRARRSLNAPGPYSDGRCSDGHTASLCRSCRRNRNRRHASWWSKTIPRRGPRSICCWGHDGP